MVAFSEPITCEVRRISLPRTPVNKGKEKRRRISLPHYLRPGSLLSGSLSYTLGRHLLVNRCPHKLAVGTHERELRAIWGDEDVAVYSGTIPNGEGACAIRLDRIRPREAIVTKNLPIKVTGIDTFDLTLAVKDIIACNGERPLLTIALDFNPILGEQIRPLKRGLRALRPAGGVLILSISRSYSS